jgi:hypothetical protein
VFGLIDGLLESGMGATALVPFLGTCALLRMALASDGATSPVIQATNPSPKRRDLPTLRDWQWRTQP